MDALVRPRDQIIFDNDIRDVVAFFNERGYDGKPVDGYTHHGVWTRWHGDAEKLSRLVPEVFISGELAESASITTGV